MDVYGSQTEEDVADRGRCNTGGIIELPLQSFGTRCTTIVCLGSYLDPKVLVPPPQQSIHILQHQLGSGVQKVKVQIETQ